MSSSHNYYNFKPDIIQITKNKDNTDIKFKDMCEYIKATLVNLMYGNSVDTDKINNLVCGCDIISVAIYDVSDGVTFDFNIYRKGITITRAKKFGLIKSVEKFINNIDYIKVFTDDFMLDYFSPNNSFADVIKKYRNIFPDTNITK
jgi:hypothetical protein